VEVRGDKSLSLSCFVTFCYVHVVKPLCSNEVMKGVTVPPEITFVTHEYYGIQGL